MPTTTTTYSFNKPVVGADEDDWGGYLNGNWDSVDDLLDGTTPVTGIDINSGTLDGVTIGGTTAGAGTFTTLTANTSITGTLATAAQPNVTSLGTLTSLTVSGDVSFGDNDKAIFGAGSDLQIYHDTANSNIRDVGTGFLGLDTNGSDVRLTSGSNAKIMGYFEKDGPVYLYYDGNGKLATTSTGVDITGTLTSDDIQLDAGSGNNTQIINYRSTDMIFGNDGSEDMRLTNSGRLGIGTSSPASPLTVSASASTVGQFITSGSSGYVEIDNSGGGGYIGTSGNNMLFLTSTSGTERMRLDSSGNLMVGKTTVGVSGVGAEMRDGVSDYAVTGTSSSSPVALFNRTVNDGEILRFRKDNVAVGSIGNTSGGRVYIESAGGANLAGIEFSVSGVSMTPRKNSASSDNEVDVGSATFRWDDVYATNGTIQTSDQNEKQQIASLTDAEITAAKAISKLFKTFKWNDSVTEKGSAARTHSGVIAQDVEQAMANAGLDAGNYAFFISSDWYVDANGDEVDADAVGAIAKNRKGIRYPELLSFVAAATEQRLTSIETRLDALEA